MDTIGKMLFGAVGGMIGAIFMMETVTIPERLLGLQQEAVDHGAAEWVMIQGPPRAEFEFRWLEIPSVEQDCAAAINGSDYMTRSE